MGKKRSFLKASTSSVEWLPILVAMSTDKGPVIFDSQVRHRKSTLFVPALYSLAPASFRERVIKPKEGSTRDLWGFAASAAMRRIMTTSTEKSGSREYWVVVSWLAAYMHHAMVLENYVYNRWAFLRVQTSYSR